jgi:hypothetical protein
MQILLVAQGARKMMKSAFFMVLVALSVTGTEIDLQRNLMVYAQYLILHRT